MSEEFNRASAAEWSRTVAAALAPGTTCEVAFDEGDGDVDMLCRVATRSDQPLPDRTCIATRPLQTREPLHAYLSRLSPVIGLPFQPGGFFSHVGSRACSRSMPTVRVEFWLKNARVTPAILRDRWLLPIAAFFSTAAGIGRIPAVGANVASVVTCLLVWSASFLANPPIVATMVAVIATVLCLFFEKPAARIFLADDAREFVLDEVAGMAVALMFLPPTGGTGLFLTGLVAFRFFDILKPGIKWVERLPIAGKIVWDDVLAGIYSGFVILVIRYLL